MTIVMLLMLLIVIGMLIFFGYQLLLKFQLENLAIENTKMKRKISIYKNRQNSRQILFLINGIILLSVLIIGLLYNQYAMKNELQELQDKVAGLETNSANGIASVEAYSENKLKLGEFPWTKVIEGDSETLRNYEVQLADEWKPYFGNTNVTIIKSEATSTMTISIAASSLSEDGYQKAVKNAEAFVKELNNVEEVTMLDFNFTYRNGADNLAKDTLVYAKDYKVENFKKV